MRARMHMAALAALALLPAVAQGQVIAITGGTVHPVSGPKIERGTVLIRDGKIAEVGANIAIPAGAPGWCHYRDDRPGGRHDRRPVGAAEPRR